MVAISSLLGDDAQAQIGDRDPKTGRPVNADRQVAGVPAQLPDLGCPAAARAGVSGRFDEAEFLGGLNAQRDHVSTQPGRVGEFRTGLCLTASDQPHNLRDLDPRVLGRNRRHANSLPQVFGACSISEPSRRPFFARWALGYRPGA